MDYNQLRRDYPQVFEQAKEEGRKEVSGKTVKQQVHDEYVQAAEALWGTEAANQLRQALDSGMSPEQLRQAKEVVGGQSGKFDMAQHVLDNLNQSQAHEGFGEN